MATHQALAATCEAVITLLATHRQPPELDGQDVAFKVYTTSDFTRPMQAGVSLFLYGIAISGIDRHPGARALGSGRQVAALPLDLHFLLTVWAQDAAVQGTLAAWTMRCLEDTPVLTASLLNATWPGAFGVGETVAITHDDLALQDLMYLWDRLGQRNYQLSIPYVARTINIESSASGSGVAVGERRKAPSAP